MQRCCSSKKIQNLSVFSNNSEKQELAMCESSDFKHITDIYPLNKVYFMPDPGFDQW